MPPAPSVLVRQGVGRTLLSMAVPMLAGTFAMNAYNLADTWFVSRLGTRALAAMGFTFPVVMLITSVARGLGTGLMLLVSHALGRNDQQAAARLTSHGLLMMTLVTVGISIGGFFAIDPVFRQLGVDAETMPLVRDYMSVWFLGAITMSLPMAGNGILISLGDSRTASRLMMLGTLLNVCLDPILIFGLLGFPAMGMRGAALATVLAQAVSAVWLLRLFSSRKHALLLPLRGLVGGFCTSCKGIIAMGTPSVITMLLMPLSAGIITKLLGRFGHEAVAAAGAAGRIEMFAFVIPMALGMSLTPFVSQNYGAERPDRNHVALRLSIRFAVLYGAVIAIIFFVSAPTLAGFFTDDPEVTRIFCAYVRIIAFGYGMMEVHRYGGFALNGLHRPVAATLLSALRVLVLLIPLSMLGAYWGGIHGLFWSRLGTDLISGVIAIAWVRKLFQTDPKGNEDKDRRHSVPHS